MDIVPVIDLRAGHAVRAHAGARETYRPVASHLCPAGDPLSLVRALRGMYPFARIYLADLDAIERSGDNRHIVEALALDNPGTDFWLDAGFGGSEDIRQARLPVRVRAVLGTETLSSIAALEVCTAALNRRQPVLSVDIRDNKLLGPTGLIDHLAAWPGELILMNLDRVGTRRGPTTRLAECAPCDFPGRRCYAAGGVRGAEDLWLLQRAGYAGALVASALHAGRLDADICRAAMGDP